MNYQQSSGPVMQQPLMGQSPQRDMLVQALMGGIQKPANIPQGNGFAGLNPLALASLMKSKPQTGIDPLTYGMTATPASSAGGGLIDSAGNYIP